MFLRRLKGEYGGESARHERPLARPRKQNIGEDEDGEPTYVQENSHDTISKAEYEALVKDAEVEKHDRKTVAPATAATNKLERPLAKPDETRQDPAPWMAQVAGIGANAKKRSAKVVGEDHGIGDSEHLNVGCAVTGTRPKTKRGKKVKLSFNEESAEL